MRRFTCCNAVQHLTVFLFLLMCVSSIVTGASYGAKRGGNRAVVPGVLYVKYRNGAGAADQAQNRIRALIEQYHPLAINRPFMMKANAVDHPQFSSVYKYVFSALTDIKSLSSQLEKDPSIEYAEPSYVSYVDRTAMLPNDSLYAYQWYIPRILADSAWSICQGDTSVIIGIVDSGTDYTHPDLAANIRVNPAEDINHNGKFDNWPSTKTVEGVTGDQDGIDNDGNGYVDDVVGWDFRGADPSSKGDNDPDPKNGNPHGTHVAGLAAAVTNNRTGIASVGNKCHLLITKHGFDTGGSDEIDFGYEGIIYHVDNGAKIVNCSWGVAGSASKFEQDAITYALRHNVLVVAAAGNGGTDFTGDDNGVIPHFPSSYRGVMSVGATDRYDVKASFSNYGVPARVKVFAPGTSILSTIPQSGYQSFGWSGTSMASPIAAGLAGLVRSLHKDWSAARVMFQMTATSDNLDVINLNYAGKMGYGRINAVRALTETTSLPGPELDILSVLVDDHDGGNGDGIPDPGETVKVIVTLQNSWGDAHGVHVSMVFDPAVQWGVMTIHPNSSIGDVSGLMQPDSSIRTNASDPLIVSLSTGLFPMVLPYTITVTADGGFSKQWSGSLSLSSRIL
ncbi:MAG: S8 family serine peptidase, partial [Ignavibacteriales bacterium]|nr:S8 family serine peptidase [Ignavibacteriales bacterium]